MINLLVDSQNTDSDNPNNPIPNTPKWNPNNIIETLIHD